jgi:hypothetical protein
MAHGDCFVQGKALAPILGGQDVIARTLTNEARTQDARNGVRQAGSTLVPGYFKLLILNFLKINTKSGARNSLRFSMVRASWGPCGMMGA